MATPPPPRHPITLEVLRTSWLTDHMVRVVLGGPGLADYVHNDFTDRYVKLLMAPRGVTYEEPFDVEAIRASRPQHEWPRLRTYTVRHLDRRAGELWIDFVHHGDEGLAGPWAANAQPGDLLRLLGPGGAYAPDPEAAWHLLIGDEAAFPAIAASIAEIPVGVPIVGVFEASDAASAAYLDVPAAAEIRRILRDGDDPTLLDAVRGLELPPGHGQAFVHGELGAMRELRRHLIDERQLPAERLSLSGYWRRGKDEEGFQAEKRSGG